MQTTETKNGNENVPFTFQIQGMVTGEGRKVGLGTVPRAQGHSGQENHLNLLPQTENPSSLC